MTTIRFLRRAILVGGVALALLAQSVGAAFATEVTCYPESAYSVGLRCENDNDEWFSIGCNEATWGTGVACYFNHNRVIDIGCISGSFRLTCLINGQDQDLDCSGNGPGELGIVCEFNGEMVGAAGVTLGDIKVGIAGVNNGCHGNGVGVCFVRYTIYVGYFPIHLDTCIAWENGQPWLEILGSGDGCQGA